MHSKIPPTPLEKDNGCQQDIDDLIPVEFTNMVLARHDIIRAIAVNHWCWRK
jgi:hypothetical protein